MHYYFMELISKLIKTYKAHLLIRFQISLELLHKNFILIQKAHYYKMMKKKLIFIIIHQFIFKI